MLLAVEGGTYMAKKLQEVIKNKINEAKVTTTDKSETATAYIKGMDSTTKINQV